MEPEHLSLDAAVDQDYDPSSSPPRANNGPAAGVVPDFGEQPDEQLVRARSRRLVSGYRFGNPPSPVATTRVPRTAELEPEDEVRSQDFAPSNDSDSPPLTEPDASPRGSDTDVLEVTTRVAALSTDSKGNLVPRPLEAPPTREYAARRRSERKRFDALAGLNDGEADEETSALRAEHGSEAYLCGERPYHFPKHRLRKTMKGEP